MKNIVYPNGEYKAVTMRFDDGPVEDRIMIGLLNEYGLKATFYLVAGYLDKNGSVTSSEIRKLYKGHEIGNHTYSHIDPRSNVINPRELEIELKTGKQSLAEFWKKPIEGYAYVCSTFGDVGEKRYKEILSKTEHKYAIMGRENRAFEPDIKDSFDVGQSFRFSDPQLISEATKYCQYDEDKLSIMFVMAHTYEFSNKSLPYDWNTVRSFFDVIAGKSDIWYATNGEVIGYLLAVNNFISYNNDKDIFKNNTDKTIFFKRKSKLIELHEGESIRKEEIYAED